MKKLFLILITLLTGCKNKAFFKQYEKDTISVRIEGEIKNPGIYELELYSKLADLIQKAGGLNADADNSSIDYNMILKENDIITIYDTETKKININTSNAKELQSIPTIGLKTAQNIIDYRTDNGVFQTYEDLLNIKGISEKKLQKILPYIKLR